MPRQLYVRLFLLFATLFVPVVVSFGLVAFIVPTAYGIFAGVAGLLHSRWRIPLGHAVYSSVYIAAFYGLARGTYWLARLSRKPRHAFLLQLMALALLFSCSFARVITYASIQGRGGTYTFWTATVRFFERHAGR